MFAYPVCRGIVRVAIAALLAAVCGRVGASEFVLARDGKPAATIITAANPTDAAAFSAQEIRYHVQKITGATLPIKFDSDKVEGTRILVGPSAATAQLGVKPDEIKDQEYLIRFIGNTLILLGNDSPARPIVDLAKTNWPVAGSGIIVPPRPLTESQGTSYAAHDFLERFCNVRWYGPGDFGMVVPKAPTLVVEPRDVRCAPAFSYRDPFFHWELKLARALYNDPSPSDVQVFWARLRAGGEAYSCNHSFGGYWDRFWKQNPQNPKVFEAAHPDWFGKDCADANGRPMQMCFSSQGLVDQVVADARKFFDGKGLQYGAQAAGNSFGIVPMDAGWCNCPTCKPQINQEQQRERWAGGLYFSIGCGSEYWYAFVNKVAREVAKTHPDKYIATLAYADYAYRPQKTQLEPNVSVQMCLHARHQWAPPAWGNDRRLYQDWVLHEKARPLYLWLYYCFPELMCGDGSSWHCFPGFSAHTIDRQLKMYARDGIRGAFVEGICDQVDTYVIFKLFDDPSLNVDALLDEFFARYYGAAGAPLKKFYLRVEDIFSTTANYPEEVQRNPRKQFHQTEEIAWKYLGTEARMAELGNLMDEATRLASAVGASEIEKQRVAVFRKAVWDYMVEGRKMYLAKQPKTP